jgi:hypothetical protein
MAASFTLRNSSRFHHPDYDLVEEFFSRVPHEPLKRYISVPIRLGATANEGDFIEDGEVYYVHPGATRKQGPVNLEDCYRVSEEFGRADRKAALQRSDIILNRAGEGTIGKVGVFESDEPAVCSDFTMRIRLVKEKMVPSLPLTSLAQSCSRRRWTVRIAAWAT